MDIYKSPFESRYSSKEMLYLFSDDKKFKTWRKLWIILAETEKELGLNITDDQIEELKKYQEEINYDLAKEYENKLRHDVMAHIHAYGDQAKLAMPIIHLGATSCYVGDNTDLIIMYEALELIKTKVINVISKLAKFADKYKSLPTLGFTHFQAAQLTTVGKRATLWLQELWLDLEEIDNLLSKKRLRGAKGTTGTQATFMNLFDNDFEKVKLLDKTIAKKLGYNDVYPVTGQTYSRKVDTQILNVLSQVAQSAYKFSNDIRLLQHLKEIEEPFEKNQIGSSAMAYKRNPMRTERISALSRFIISLPINSSITASTQWFERTLDDSANKRLVISEAFLALDAVLETYLNVASNLVVYPKVIQSHIEAELPFMATEIILMEGVKRGGDRQELHEKIRVLSMEASKNVKQEGQHNDLIERIIKDGMFNISKEEILGILDAQNFIGAAPMQVDSFLNEVINPILENNKDIIGRTGEVRV
ncbi:adenylosuccinate lyase [Candidatus Epulonipiscium fishelsonii]|uniref:Adenylosuccinate lyase n=1 Tax=Candidatus Epulonipiscium fishelsonii TaxID=77094 RepID=A0ACC8XEC5_9FIRM|nr:adenylosuccinate lyase [Epulopiscium sp. SCG-B05WGA-EpuloA1]ONI41522.1 adenylosuccinate lyase [Epulopiscium sp. SCG-B11WGA-EpuloA1]